MRSPLPVRASVDLVTRASGPGMHRRIDIAEGPLVGRESGRWDACTIRGSSEQLLFGEFGIDQCQREQWNARSQAANQGYSHLSGMEMTSALTGGAIRVAPLLAGAGGAG